MTCWQGWTRSSSVCHQRREGFKTLSSSDPPQLAFQATRRVIGVSLAIFFSYFLKLLGNGVFRAWRDELLNLLEGYSKRIGAWIEISTLLSAIADRWKTKAHAIRKVGSPCNARSTATSFMRILNASANEFAGNSATHSESVFWDYVAGGGN